MDIEIISERDRLVSLIPQWESLARSSFYQNPHWLIAWWDHFATPHMQLHMLVVRDDGQHVIAIAPLYSDLQSKSLRVLGDRTTADPTFPVLLAPNTNRCTASIDQGAKGTSIDQLAIERILQTISSGSKPSKNAVRLRFSGLDPRELSVLQLQQSLEQNNFAVHSAYCSQQWETTNSINRPSQPAHSIGSDATSVGLSDSSGLQRAEDSDSITSYSTDREHTRSSKTHSTPRVRWMLEESDVDEWNESTANAATRWISVNALATDEAHRQFILDAATRFANTRQLLSFYLCHEGKTIASMIGFRHANIWYSYGVFISSSLPEVFNDPSKLIQFVDTTMLMNMERFGVERIVSSRAMVMLPGFNSQIVPYLSLECQIPTFLASMKLWAQDARKNWNLWRQRRRVGRGRIDPS